VGTYPDNEMCRPRTDAIFKFRVCSTDVQYPNSGDSMSRTEEEGKEKLKPIEIRDFG